MKTTAEIIRGLREDHDLKQSVLAQMLHMSQQQYSNYETGESDLPLKSLLLLADFYKVQTDYLLGRTACKDSIESLNTILNADYTVGALVSDVLSLNEKGRASVIDYVDLQKLRKKYDN